MTLAHELTYGHELYMIVYLALLLKISTLHIMQQNIIEKSLLLNILVASLNASRGFAQEGGARPPSALIFPKVMYYM